MTVCACMGRQGKDPFCPCEMRARGLQPSDAWTEEEVYNLKRALNRVFPEMTESSEMNETFYICIFKFRDMTCQVETTKGIDAFRDGFWVNSDMEYTVGSDCLYWIPPNAIKFIQKQIRGLL